MRHPHQMTLAPGIIVLIICLLRGARIAAHRDDERLAMKQLHDDAEVLKADLTLIGVSAEIDEADIADPHLDPQRRTGIQMLAFLQIGLRDQPLCLLLLIHRAEAAGALTQERLHDALHLLDLKLTAVFDPRV